MGILETIGARIREERVRLGANLRDFSEKAGVHTNSQSAYESGKTSCNAAYLAILGDLGVDLSYVFTGRRGDGSLGFQEQALLDMFATLSLREKEAILSAVMVLTGNVVDVAQLDEWGKFAKSRRGSLHSPSSEFKAEGE